MAAERTNGFEDFSPFIFDAVAKEILYIFNLGQPR